MQNHSDLYYNIFLPVGAFNKLNRQFRYSNECQRLSAQKNSNLEQNVLELLKETKEIKQHLVHYNYHMRMDTADISHFFPLKSNEDLKKFMAQDEEWNQRKKESFF